MAKNCVCNIGFWLLFFVLFGCQASHGGGRVKLQDFYQEKGVIQLAEAAADGDVKRVDALVARGENVNAVGRDGMTPLLWAFMAKNKTGMKRLLELGASPGILIKSGESVTGLAAAMEDSEFLEMILAQGGSPNVVNPESDLKPTPLFISIVNINVANVHALIESGADLNYRRDSGIETPLIAAAELNQWEIVYALLMAGADYKLENRWGNTVVYFIEHNSIGAPSELFQWRQKVIDFLRGKGVSVNPAVPMT